MVFRTTLVLAVCAVLTGCTGGSPDAGGGPVPVPTQIPEIAALVPDGIAADSTLTIATDPNYAPLEFLGTDGKVQGADVDLAVAVAEVLGLQPEFEQDAFTEIPVGVRTGRYELGVAGLTVRRGQRLLNNAVLYLKSGSQLVRATSDTDLTRTTLCGAAVAAIEGSVQIEELVETSRECRQQGRASVDIVPFSDQEEATASVLDGRTAGLLADSPVTQDVVARFPADLEAASRIYDRQPLGMITAAEYTRFTRAVRQALQQLVDSGYYGEVLDRWNIDDGRMGRISIKWADYARPARS